MASFDASSVAADAGLDQFRWKNRLLLSFAPNQSADPQAQREGRLAALDAWQDRDLVLIEVGPDHTVRVDGRSSADLDGAALRRQFRAEQSTYLAVLVGKDGTEKLRAGGAIANQTLFEVIDAMPMRQSEMRRRRR